jgi:pilus assembly protein CpaE
MPSVKDGRGEHLKILLLAEGDAERSEVRAALAQLNEPRVDISDGDPRSASVVSSSEVDAIVVVFSPDSSSQISYLQRQSREAEHPVLLAVLRDRSYSIMRSALRAGAGEVLFLPLDLHDAARALLKICETRRPIDVGGPGAMVLSMASITGGVGVTSVTANLALALNYGLRKKVAVVDLDLQSGDLGMALNLEPERTIVDVADPGRKLDSIVLDSVLTLHPSGLYLLAAPKRIEESERIGVSDVGGILDLMRQLFDVVLVDCGGPIDEVMVTAWERSEHLLYIVDQSLNSVRGARRFFDLFSKLGLSAVNSHLVVNRFSSTHSIGEEQITRTLGRPIYACVPRDDSTLQRALNGSKANDSWTIAPNGALSRSLQELARKLAGVDQEQEHSPRRGGILSRIFGPAPEASHKQAPAVRVPAAARPDREWSA